MVNPLSAQPGMTCNAEEDMSDLRMGEKRSLERGRSLLPLPNMVNVLQGNFIPKRQAFIYSDLSSRSLLALYSPRVKQIEFPFTSELSGYIDSIRVN